MGLVEIGVPVLLQLTIVDARLLVQDPEANPDLAGAHRVLLWYCDGASVSWTWPTCCGFLRLKLHV